MSDVLDDAVRWIGMALDVMSCAPKASGQTVSMEELRAMLCEQGPDLHRAMVEERRRIRSEVDS